MGGDRSVHAHCPDECSRYLTAEGKLLRDHVGGKELGVWERRAVKLWRSRKGEKDHSGVRERKLRETEMANRGDVGSMGRLNLVLGSAISVAGVGSQVEEREIVEERRGRG
jgi:hypothetical protein